MNKKNILVGVIFILISVWFYSALSTFKVVPGSVPQSIIVREGVERSVEEVAEALANEMGFDLEGAYKSGYTPIDVVEYLIREPHKYPISFHNGKFYEGRITVLRIFPLSACIILFLIGLGIIIFKGKSKK
jgi:hypothetical protein